MEPPRPFFFNPVLLICEKVVMESDGALSLIRMVDVFHTPQPLTPAPAIIEGDPLPTGMPAINAFIVASVKAGVGYAGTHTFEIKLQTTAGELVRYQRWSKPAHL